MGKKFTECLRLLGELRVCLASSWYPNAENPYCGIFVHEFAKRIHKVGIKVFVLTSSHSFKNTECNERDGIPVFRIKLNNVLSFLNPLKLLVFFKAFKKADIIHIHAIDVFGSVSVFLAKFLKKPVVITVHRGDVLPSASMIFKLLRLIALKVANRIIAVSNATKKLALKCGAPNNKVVVVYNAVDESVFYHRAGAPCKSKLSIIPQNSKVILSVGNLIPRKGFSCLIRALPRVLIDIPNTVLIIVGDGPQRDELVLLVNDLKLTDKVIFTGRITTADLCLYYGAADVFVLPSFHEGHAMVLLEAMATGLPVVATRVGGNIETVIDGKNGYLVQPGNVNQLAQAIIKILSDERLMHEFSSQSLRLYNKNFSEEQQIRKISQIYLSLTHRNT